MIIRGNQGRYPRQRAGRPQGALVLLGVAALACQEPRGRQPAVVPPAPPPAVSAADSPASVGSSAPVASAAPVDSPALPSAFAAFEPPAPAPPGSARPPVVRSPAFSAACDGPDQRKYGTTCCTAFGTRQTGFPGQTILACNGPQIGSPCRRKQDCDVECSCGMAGGPQPPGRPKRSPPSGARGRKGVCGGELLVGVWMCEIDEKGLVTHKIID